MYVLYYLVIYYYCDNTQERRLRKMNNNVITNNNMDKYLKSNNGYKGIGVNMIPEIRKQMNLNPNVPLKAHMASGGMFGYK